MNDIVLAVDAAKRKSTVGLFRRTPGPPGPFSEPEITCLIRPHDVKHCVEELDALVERIRRAGVNPAGLDFIVESTGSYDRPISCYLKSKGMRMIRINPLYGAVPQGASIRRTKTDSTDAAKLAQLYFSGRFKNSRELPPEQEEARRLSFRIERLEDISTRLKSSLRMLVGEGFLEVERNLNLSRIGQNGLLRLLYKYPTAALLARARLKSISAELGGPKERADERAAEIQQLARLSICRTTELGECFCEVVRSMIDQLRDLESETDRLVKLLVERMSATPIYRVLKSFNGIGDKSAAMLSAELGDISVYSTPQKLISAAGLDPSIRQSGDSIDSHGRITKRGSRHARRVLFRIVHHITMVGAKEDSAGKLWSNGEIYTYYLKKRAEGKSSTASKIAAMAKLLRKVYYRFRDFQRTGVLKVA